MRNRKQWLSFQELGLGGSFSNSACRAETNAKHDRLGVLVPGVVGLGNLERVAVAWLARPMATADRCDGKVAFPFRLVVSRPFIIRAVVL